MGGRNSCFTTCRMRISGVSDPSIQDTSSSNFAIVQSVPSKASIVAGASHTLTQKNDDTVWAWGSKTFGQLGLGDTSDRFSPVQVPINLNP